MCTLFLTLLRSSSSNVTSVIRGGGRGRGGGSSRGLGDGGRVLVDLLAELQLALESLFCFGGGARFRLCLSLSLGLDRNNSV